MKETKHDKNKEQQNPKNSSTNPQNNQRDGKQAAATNSKADESKKNSGSGKQLGDET